MKRRKLIDVLDRMIAVLGEPDESTVLRDRDGAVLMDLSVRSSLVSLKSWAQWNAPEGNSMAWHRIEVAISNTIASDHPDFERLVAIWNDTEEGER